MIQFFIQSMNWKCVAIFPKYQRSVIIESIYLMCDRSRFDMLFELGRRYSLLIISLLISLIFLIEASCTTIGLPAQVNPPDVTPAVTDNITTPTLLGIKSFTAEPKTIKPGETTTLSWKVTGASSISIDPDIGTVTETTGSVSISPRGTTLFTLKASDARTEMIARVLVIIKTAEGTIIWADSGSDNITAQPQLYEGWTYYPNKYVEWNIIDRYRDPYGDTDTCSQVGYIINNHGQWMMTEITVNKKSVADFILPSSQRSYTISVDCQQLPELKWKWKVYK